MELTRAVGENIKRIRKSKKLSMERLAAESGVSRSMLGQIERGEATPSVAILGKLAKVLKVPAETLLENDDFQSLLLSRELDNKARRLDGGKAVQRPLRPGALGARLRLSCHRHLRYCGIDGGGGDFPAAGAGCPAVCRRPALRL